jgi:hypothetical protein
MRRLFLLAWLLVPVGAGAYHFGPGQERLREDEMAVLIDAGRKSAATARATAAREGDDAARSDWVDADEAFTQALALVPAEQKDLARVLRVERAKAREFTGKLFDARAELEQVVNDLTTDPTADKQLLGEARDALANAQYYSTWLLRLEGAPKEEWGPQIEASRQNYKLLAQEAADRKDVEVAALATKDLEAAIRLERMSLEDLQGLPLPSQ